MKKILIAVLLIASGSLVAQNFYAEFGLGGGSAFNSQSREVKGLLSVGAGMELSEKISLGVELATGGSLFPNGGSNITQSAKIFSPESFRFDLVLLKGIYWLKSADTSPFFGIGLGLGVPKQYIHAINRKSVFNANFLGAIDIGYKHEGTYIFSMQYVPIGITPDFEGIDPSGLNISLKEKRFSLLLIKIAYRISLD